MSGKKETDSGCVDKVQPSGLRDQLDVWGKGVEVVKKKKKNGSKMSCLGS